jgi:hypothetical protein
MAFKRDIEPGFFESVANIPVGSFVLDQWQHIKLDGFLPYLMNNIVLKQGVTVIPQGSSYEIKADPNASVQESTVNPGTSLYGLIKVTNPIYAGVDLNITGNNYGTFTSNDGIVELVESLIAGKIAPGSDAFIAAGELAVFEDSSGLSIISDNSGEIPAWDPGPSYPVAGTLTRIERITATSTGSALNQNKNPLLQKNTPFWFIPPSFEELMRFSNNGTVFGGSMHVVHDRSDVLYSQNILLFQKIIGIVLNYWSMVHLDGTVVTGNTTLEDDIFKVGTAEEWAYIDLYAPDVLGTRTLLDKGGYGARDMTTGGGVADILAELQIDEQLRITGQFSNEGRVFNGAGVFTLSGNGAEEVPGTGQVGISGFDSANSVLPIQNRTNDVENRDKSLVTGASAVIVQHT